MSVGRSGEWESADGMDGVVQLVYESGYRTRDHVDLGKDNLTDLLYVCNFCTNDISKGYYVSTTPAPGQAGQPGLLDKVWSFVQGAEVAAVDFAEKSHLTDDTSTENPELEAQIFINESAAVCEISESIDWVAFNRYALLPAAIVIILLSFFLQRRRLGLGCCSGRPGLIYPVDLVDYQKHRFTYVAAFTLIAWHMLEIIFNGPPFYDFETAPTRDVFPYPTWVVMPSTKAFFVAIGCIQFAFTYYPIFAALSSHHILGYILGMLYTWMMAVVFSLDDIFCPKGRDKIMIMFNYLSSVPPMVCQAYLCIVFPVRVIQELCGQKPALEAQAFPETIAMDEALYVKEMMRRHKLPPPPAKPPLCQRIMSFIYVRTPGFKYSVSVLTGASMGICFSFMVFIWSLEWGYIIWTWFDKFLKPAVVAANGGYSWKNKQTLIWDIIIYIMEMIHHGQCMIWAKRIIYFLDSLKSCYIAACVLAWINIVVCVLLAVKNYKTNMLMIYQGRQHDVHPASDYSPSTLLLAAARYVGFQAAYATWGYMIQGFLLFLGFFVASAMMNLMCRDTLILIIKVLIQYFWITIAVVVVVFLTQYLMGRFLFLLKNEHGERVLALDNRRLYFNFNYFAIFSNTALGVVSCIIRIVKSIGLGLYILPRLDMSTLNRHFEWFDASFMSFVGLLYMENAHRNPVMLVAAGFLSEGHIKRRPSHGKVFVTTEKNAKNSPLRRFTLVRTRWNLAWTLYNNPGLRLHRKKAMLDRELVIKMKENHQQPLINRTPISHIPVPVKMQFPNQKMQPEMKFLYENANLRPTPPPVTW